MTGAWPAAEKNEALGRHAPFFAKSTESQPFLVPPKSRGILKDEQTRSKMPVNLPTTLLRSFVAIVDTGSMLNAAEHVFVTQSALSLQIKRLEELVQQPLFTREDGDLH